MLNKNKSESYLSDRPLLLKQSQYEQLKVAIRVRPPLTREIDIGLPFRSVVHINNANRTCSLVEYIGAEYEESERQREWVECPHYFQYHRFTFDNVYDMGSTQEEVYLQTAKPSVDSVLRGYNSTLIAYGQTGTGKTYTMEGFTYDYQDPNRGIIPRTIEDIFRFIETNANSNKFIIRATYLQIYNESISDLLKPEKKNLSIREDKKRGLYVESLSEWAVRSPNDIYALLERGAASRARANTTMNDVSSRSHAVFAIQVEQMTMNTETGGKQIKVGKLNLVDLAGSERIRVTKAKGKQLEESKNINKSLSALGNVIYALTDNKNRTHIPYRDSKLTRLLETSLGGNCITTMLAMISPAQCSFNESMSTLNFAKRAKNIKNKAVVNEDVDHSTLIRQYESELKKLRIELEEKDRLLHSNDFVAELEEKKKQAEKDKDEAIQALEQASIKYLQERDEKNKLESKIKIMNFQMIPGGQKVSIEDTPQFQTLLQKHQILLEKSFEEKLFEIEKERVEIEESKVQADQYNKLLYKQRDIMNGLTTSLNERDENIAQLQEEIEAYDKITKEQEKVIDNREKRIKLLESILNKNNIDYPKEDEADFNIVSNISEIDQSKQRVYFPYNELNEKTKDIKGLSMSNIVTVLSADEKIDELNSIVKEKEEEITVMKKISDRYIQHTVENGKLNIASIIPYSNTTSNNLSNTNVNNLSSNNIIQSFKSKEDLINKEPILPSLTSPNNTPHLSSGSITQSKLITHLQALKENYPEDQTIQDELEVIINTLQEQLQYKPNNDCLNNINSKHINNNGTQKNNHISVIKSSIKTYLNGDKKDSTPTRKELRNQYNIQYIHASNKPNENQNNIVNINSKPSEITLKLNNINQQISNQMTKEQGDLRENTIKNIKVTSVYNNKI